MPIDRAQESYFGFAPWIETVGLSLLTATIGYLSAVTLFFVGKRLITRFGAEASAKAATRVRKPLQLVLPLAGLLIVLPFLHMTEQARQVAQHGLWVLLVVSVTWLLIRVARAVEEIIRVRFPITIADNRRARRIATLTQIARHIVIVGLVLIGAAAALMTFPQARTLGASVLASAGVAGIVVGMAARPALGNLIAGVQIALSEPLAIDDVVIVDKEYGNVEEIAMTYVVIRTWDLRRLIVPISRFIEQPFENWTRVTTELLGTVLIHTDFLAPVDAVRTELTRLLKSNPLWDGRVNAVHVTDATGGRLELRLLMSASNSSKLFDLRCAIREGMVEYLKTNHPESLARTRMTVVGPGAATAATVIDAADMDTNSGSDVRPGTPA
jgi:small-conductance mechanosensitive channel